MDARGVYAYALQVAALATEHLTRAPFPDLNGVAQAIGVDPAEVADCIRIVALLPRERALAAGVSPAELETIPWEVLVESALAGSWERRLARLKP